MHEEEEGGRGEGRAHSRCVSIAAGEEKRRRKMHISSVRVYKPEWSMLTVGGSSRHTANHAMCSGWKRIRVHAEWGTKSGFCAHNFLRGTSFFQLVAASPITWMSGTAIEPAMPKIYRSGQ